MTLFAPPLLLLQCDRLYGWKSAPDTPIRDAFKRQKDFVMKEFETRSEQVFLQLNEQVRTGRCLLAQFCNSVTWPS